MATAARHGDAGGGMGGDSDGDVAPAPPVLHSALRVTQGPTALHPGDPLSFTLGTPRPAPWGSPALSLKIPCPCTPILPHPTAPGVGERRHSSPQWPLGPHRVSRNLRDTGARAGMRCRDTVPELSTVAQGRGSQSGTETGRAWGFWGAEPGPCCSTRSVPPTPTPALGTLSPPATCPGPQTQGPSAVAGPAAGTAAEQLWPRALGEWREHEGHRGGTELSQGGSSLSSVVN